MVAGVRVGVGAAEVFTVEEEEEEEVDEDDDEDDDDELEDELELVEPVSALRTEPISPPEDDADVEADEDAEDEMVATVLEESEADVVPVDEIEDAAVIPVELLEAEPPLGPSALPRFRMPSSGERFLMKRFSCA